MTGAAGGSRLAWRPASIVQDSLWSWLRNAAPGSANQVRALRLRGTVDEARLVAAIEQVSRALSALRLTARDSGAGLTVADCAQLPPVMRVCLQPGDASEAGCVAVLRADRNRPFDLGAGPLVRFHVITVRQGDVVFGIVGHQIALDLRSLYAVLGMVLQAYFGRFRAPSEPVPGSAGISPLGPAAIRRRTDWWRRRLAGWTGDAGAPGTAPVGRATESIELRIAGPHWHRLAELTQPYGGNSSLAVVSLVAWWLRASNPCGRPPRFGSMLDLRDVFGLGPLLGPLSDRIIFAVELDGRRPLSFRELLLRTHAGLLDTVIHYLPYDVLLQLGAGLGRVTAPRTARFWDFFVHYCRAPLSSAYTRNEDTLLQRGLSVELFAESVLVPDRSAVPDTRWEGVNYDLYIAETGDDMTLVLDYNREATSRAEMARMFDAIDGVIEQVVAAPAAPLPVLP